MNDIHIDANGNPVYPPGMLEACTAFLAAFTDANTCAIQERVRRGLDAALPLLKKAWELKRAADAPYGLPEAQVTGDPYEKLAATFDHSDAIAVALHKLAIEDWDDQNNRKACAREALTRYQAERQARSVREASTFNTVEHRLAFATAKSKSSHSNLSRCYLDLRRKLDEAAAKISMRSFEENTPGALADGYLTQDKRANQAEVALHEEKVKNRELEKKIASLSAPPEPNHEDELIVTFKGKQLRIRLT